MPALTAARLSPLKTTGTDGGYEYKSQTTLFGLPLVHISFKFRPNRTPVLARGIVAIGQFGCGVITIAQFGIGVFGLCQFALAGFAVAQFAFAYSLLAQIGLYIHEGHGQIVRNVADLLALLL